MESLTNQTTILKNTINKKQSSQQQNQYISLLYSGNNSDANGNKIPNPSLFSQTRFYKHTNVNDKDYNEKLMRIGQTEMWQSLDFIDELVYIKDNKIYQRINYQKQLSADFDYRFCPVKIIQPQNLFDKKKQQMILSYANSVIDLSRFYYEMSLSEQDVIKTEIKQIQYYQNPNNLNQIQERLRFMQDCLHLLHLTQLKMNPRHIQYRTDLSNDSLSKYNIFENCESNVQIRNSNVYLNHIPSNIKFQNIQILKSNDIVLMGNQNVKIQDSDGIYMKESQYQGDIYIYHGTQLYLGNNFACNGGIFQFINMLSTFISMQQTYLIVDDNVLKSGKLTMIDCLRSQIVFEDNSLQYSDSQISDAYFSKILLEKKSCQFSNILIQKSFKFSYLNIMQDAIFKGQLICQLDAFNDNSVCGINCKSIKFPVGIKYFYFDIQINQLEILYGTQYMVQNTICYNGSFNNGPFNEGQKQNIRKPQYLLTVQPGIYTEKKYWWGYNVIDQNVQTLQNWGEIPW